MNPVFKGLLFSFFPILIYIAAELFLGEQWAILLAIATGFIELGWTYVKEKKVEKIIVFDVALLALLGTISYFLENSLLFKFKPAVLQALFTIIIGIHLFSSNPILYKITHRQFKAMKIGPEQMKRFDQSLFPVFWILLIHTGMIVYSALFLSREWWAFIAGFLLYILLALWFAGQFFYFYTKRKKYDNDEWVDAVDQSGKPVGKVPRSVAHNGSFILHPVVHLHVFNSKGEILLQKRSMNKEIQPGVWDTAVGGHIASGESVEKALIRESDEELGLRGFRAVPLFRYIMKNNIEQELVYAFKTVHDGPFDFNKEEITETSFFTKDDIQLHKNSMTPNFLQEFEILKRINLL